MFGIAAALPWVWISATPLPVPPAHPAPQGSVTHTYHEGSPVLAESDKLNAKKGCSTVRTDGSSIYLNCEADATAALSRK